MPLASPAKRRRKIALACQGGGSHTAFTAGLLCGLLEQYARELRSHIEIVALSGTSGGAICALLAWYGLLTDDPRDGAKRLRGFWHDNEARAWWDQLLNDWVIGLRAFEKLLSQVGLSVVTELNPYQLERLRPWLAEPWRSGTDPAQRLRRLLTTCIPFDHLPGLVQRHPRPRLLVGAADVKSGTFQTFRSDAEWPEITPEALLASAALPTLLEAVTVQDAFGRVHAYWDGLFSQNPPVRDLTAGLEPDDKPDEIWVIQINPQRRATLPRDLVAILDRRNELAGNLSLNQELGFIKEVNQHLHPSRRRAGQAAGVAGKKPIAICRIELPPDLAGPLDELSKLRRDPEFIERLLRRGEEHAAEFVARWRSGRVRFERYPVEAQPPCWSPGQAAERQACWSAVKERFLAAGSDPERQAALAEADRLVSGLMVRRGYPVAAFGARRRDIALEHPEVAARYAEAHATARKPAASVGEREAALRAYDALVPELLALAAHPRITRRSEADGAGGAAGGDRALFRPDEETATLAYELHGPRLTRAGSWSIRLAPPAGLGRVILHGRPEALGVLTPDDLPRPPGTDRRREFNAALQAVTAGNTVLEVATSAGVVLRGQIQ